MLEIGRDETEAEARPLAQVTGAAPAAGMRAPSGNVLVLGDDMRIFLSVTRALGRAGRVVHAAPTDRKSPALRSRYIHRIHDTPDFSADPQAWRAAIAGIVAEFSIDLIIPCTDPPIIALDASRGAFDPAAVAIPSPESMDIFFDKGVTHDVCRQVGIPVLDAVRLAEAGGADEIEARFGIPVVIKPLRSFWADRLHDRDKVHIVESRAQLEAVLAEISDPRRFLVERYFEGQGVGISVLADHGEVFQAFQHRRLREGKGGCSSYRISETPDPAMLEACASLCRHTGHHGVSMFELRRNAKSSEWVLIEVNCRFWGSMPLPTSLGVDYPNRLYDLLVLGKRREPADYPAGIRSRNHVLDGFNLVKRLREGDLASMPALAGDIASYAVQPLRWITGSERNDSFVADDLAPAFAEALTLPGGMFRKLKGK
jgi:predicted ATP-grasp superfamily ATP-dependent carboligase